MAAYTRSTSVFVVELNITKLPTQEVEAVATSIPLQVLEHC